MYDVIIIGGGLGGLISSIVLSRSGFKVLLIEKNTYPFHRVCGEYISNEVIPFLEKHDLFPFVLGPSRINQLMISATSGSYFRTHLDLGGFGVSRFQYDLWLAHQAENAGVKLLQNTTVKSINQRLNWEVTTTSGNSYQSRLVIGAHGKRAKLDQTLKRSFLQYRSPYVGVKYHLEGPFDQDTIALHNFKGGYCGFSKVEGNTYNLCYLAHRESIRQAGTIEAFERQVVLKNPHIRTIWENAHFLFEKPEVVNEITFKAKEPVMGGILFVGDAAGMITPLAGNGMAMAIRSAALVCEIIQNHTTNNDSKDSDLLQNYESRWNATFRSRLRQGRIIQKTFFSHPISSSVAVFTGRFFNNIADAIIRQTHGEPFS